MKNRLLVGFVGLLCTMDLCSMKRELSHSNSVQEGLDVLGDLSLSNLELSSPGLTPTPVSPNGLSLSQEILIKMLKNSMHVSDVNPVMKKPTKAEIDEVFKKLLQGDTQFKRDKRNLFQLFKKGSDHYDPAHSMDVYFNALNYSCVVSVKSLITNNALNFEIQKPYITWVAKGIAVKILLSDVKTLVGTYLFGELKFENVQKLKSENIQLSDDLCISIEAINLLKHAEPGSKIHSIITKFDTESKKLLIEEIASIMVKTICSHSNAPKDQTLVLQEKIRQQQLKRKEFDKIKAERDMAQRYAAWSASREEQKSRLRNQL